MPVHLRLNDKDTSRNPYINFVTALPGPRQGEALRRLQQLAAMVKPLMKDQGFHINSLEEYEHNREFAGRCWNNGEVVELVLTTADGSWRPLQFVLYVFCHELAHIKHMNHIPHLHGALTRHLKQLALDKQKQGYYGDGLWSSGRALQDGGFVTGLGMNAAQQDLPENVCGGAFRRARGKRASGGKRRRGASTPGGRKFRGPSLHTGAQTSSNTRGGNRRVKLEAESSSGNRVDGRDWIRMASAKNKEYKLDENSTFRKRTQSKDARERRAAAALARFATLQGASSSIKTEARPFFKTEPKQEMKGDATAEEESVTESSGESIDEDDYDDSTLVGNDLGESDTTIIKEEPEEYQFTQAADTRETAEQRRRRMRRFDDRSGAGGMNDNAWGNLLDDVPPANGRKEAEGSTTQERANVKVEDVDDQDDEVVLLTSPVRNSVSPSKKEASPAKSTLAAPLPLPISSSSSTKEWSCLLCTLRNPTLLQRCAACDTTRGKSTLGA